MKREEGPRRERGSGSLSLQPTPALKQPAPNIHPPPHNPPSTNSAGNPRHDLRRGGTFLEVQRRAADAGAAADGDAGAAAADDANSNGAAATSTPAASASASAAAAAGAPAAPVASAPAAARWEVVATDGDWETKFYWERHSTISAHSFATVKWAVPADAADGVYRVVHYGAARTIWGGGEVRQYVGTSGQFVVARDAGARARAARRFEALSRAAAAAALKGGPRGAAALAKGAAGGLELAATALKNLRAREPAALGGGLALPQALSPPRPDKWWRATHKGGCGGDGGASGGGGSGGGGDGRAAAEAGPRACVHPPPAFRATLAREVHRRCPEWWRDDGGGGAAACALLARAALPEPAARNASVGGGGGGGVASAVRAAAVDGDGIEAAVDLLGPLD